MAEGFITRKGGGVNVNDATATTNDVLQGETFYSGDKDIKTGNIPSKSAETFTPTTSNQTISSGQYLSGTQTILGDPDLVPENIRENTNIFGVTGTLTAPSYYLSFDGVDDRVLLPDTTVFNFNNQDFRVDITFNANDVNSVQRIFTKSEDFNNPGGCNGWGLRITIENGGLKVGYVTETPSCAGHLTNSVPINANQTYEVSVRWTDGVKMEIFLDGVLVETHTNTNSNLRDNGFSHIGTFRDNNGNFVDNFDGNIYYLSVYNNGIKNAEYLFNESLGTTLNDNVGNNDGTIVGATWVQE